MTQRAYAALLACSGLLAGCGLWSNDAEDGPGHAGSTSAAGATGEGGTSSQGGVTSVAGSGFGGDTVVISEQCVAGLAVTSQIPRLLNRQYEAVMRDLLGVTSVADSRVSDLLVGDSDGPMSTAAWKVYQDVGEKIAQMVMTGPNRSKFISCDPAQAGCLDDTIKTFGRKAFRRPLSDDEVARFQQLGKTTPAPSAEELAETTLYAFLVSPSFLMLPELATDKQWAGTSQTVFALSSYEVATRLSMFIWGSIPDDQLDAAADKDALQDKASILVQAQRMLLVKEKAAPMLEAFHQRWTHVDDPSGHWYKVGHDTAKYPLFSAKAAAIMPAEMNAFFDDVMFGHGTFKDYFLSNAAFVNQDTAAIYGLDPKGFGSDLKRVELDAKQRSGFLTRAGFLSSYSSYVSSSPFMRGSFISLNLLGVQQPPQAPP